MYRYRAIVVDLNFDKHDSELIKYAENIVKFAKTERIYFVHVEKTLEIPEKIRSEYPEIIEPLDEYEERAIKEEVEAVFTVHSKTAVHFEVLEGDHLDAILHFIAKKDIDLIICGRDSESDKLNRALRLTRKAPCSVLSIPPGTSPDVQKIMIPVDFNKFSGHAIDVAVAFASAMKITEISCIHCYSVPTGYYKTGKSYEEFAEIMKNNALDEFKEFVEKIDARGVTLIPEMILSDQCSEDISNQIYEGKADLIVTGARGRAKGVSVLLGSITEELMEETEVPVLAVKEKGAGMNFLQALLEI